MFAKCHQFVWQISLSLSLSLSLSISVFLYSLSSNSMSVGRLLVHWLSVRSTLAKRFITCRSSDHRIQSDSPLRSLCACALSRPLSRCADLSRHCHHSNAVQRTATVRLVQSRDERREVVESSSLSRLTDLGRRQWLMWFCETGGGGSPDEARLEQTPYPFHTQLIWRYLGIK